jgi:hypothetical protein
MKAIVFSLTTKSEGVSLHSKKPKLIRSAKVGKSFNREAMIQTLGRKSP